ncbi:hypothetical protein BWZ22_12675 [Seonamhaeicola sp. S2-3]|uniref:hypothetical protein n=1 Tax=Seonamhaeicola sp. S2-3 TaxID=1936081 RepID=UPI000972748D|nr:hypothetical protein [Seonamhaeicola sp. S2-3]APY12029.1 hypothetical protein BWZ22_12675 [Seonamhaeicola sp. S2-3]
MTNRKYVIIISLIVLNGFLIIKLNNYSKVIKDISTVLKNKKKELLELEQNIIEVGKSENIKLNENIKLIDANGNIILTKDIFKKNTLVFRYSESNCTDCIKAEFIAILKNNALIANDICLIVHYRNPRDLHVFSKVLQNRGLKNFKMYLLPDKGLNTPADKLNMPYYFCIDSTLRTSNFFIPHKDKSQLSESYLINVSKNFLSNNTVR